MFSTTDATTLLLAFTSPDWTRFVVARRALDDTPFATTALARAVTVTDSDLPAGQDQALSVEDVDTLLDAVARRAPGALDCVYLSDAGGDALVLDAAELRIGSTPIDLNAPLEWRAFLFQERGAYAASVCQATWIGRPTSRSSSWLRSPATAAGWAAPVPPSARPTRSCPARRATPSRATSA